MTSGSVRGPTPRMTLKAPTSVPSSASRTTMSILTCTRRSRPGQGRMWLHQPPLSNSSIPASIRTDWEETRAICAQTLPNAQTGRTLHMPLHRAVVNGVLYEVEDGERAKPRGSDPLELAKCGCYGNGCENIAIEYPGTGFVIRNIGQQRVRVGIQMLSGWDCGGWS